MNSRIGFSEWYKARLSHLPLLGQGALWYLFGFIWIPIWYFRTRDSARSGASTGAALFTGQFDVAPAPAWKRLVGFLVDSAVGIGLGIAFVSVLSPTEQREVGRVFLLVTPLYSTMLLEALFGRTLGKLLTGTRVIGVDRRKPGWGRAFLRMLVRCIPFEPLSLRKGVMWHDRLSGTRVADSVAVESASLEAALRDDRVLGQAAAAVDATHRAAEHLEQMGMADRADALRSAAASAQAAVLGDIDPGGYSGEYRLLNKRTAGGGVVFWIRAANAGDDKDFLFKILLAEAANLPGEFRQRFLQGNTFPERRTVACPKGGHELHIDLRQ
jgi:uncharacterized RDD family membrane protein YckC